MSYGKIKRVVACLEDSFNDVLPAFHAVDVSDGEERIKVNQEISVANWDLETLCYFIPPNTIIRLSTLT